MNEERKCIHIYMSVCRGDMVTEWYFYDSELRHNVDNKGITD